MLTDEHPKWEFREEHQYYRQILKKLLGHLKIQERLLAMLIQCVSSSSKQQAMSRVLGLIRNILAIPDTVDAFKTGNGLSHTEIGKSEHVLRSMRDSKLMEFLLVAAGSAEQAPFLPHVTTLCEIFHYVFGAFSPAQVAAGPEATARALEAELEEEERRPMKRPIRHSNFSGSIVFRLSTGQDYILRQGSYFNGALDLDAGKKTRRIGGRRRAPLAFTDFGAAQKGICSHADLAMMSNLAKEFLDSCFNVLIRHLVAEELPGRINDDRFHWHLLRLTTWFLIYARKASAVPINQIHETVKLSSIYAALEIECLLAYGRLLHRFHEESKHNGDLLLTCVVFFREVLRTIEAMNRSNSDAARGASDLQNALFYRMDLLQRFRLILKTAVKPTHQALCIMVETIHVLFKLLEDYCTSRGPMGHYVGQASRRRNINTGSDDDDNEEDTEEDERVVERRFEFNQFLSEWANEPILLAYTALLTTAPAVNDLNINRYLAVMFYRLHTTCHASALFHKVYFLDAVHRFLRSPAMKASPGLSKVLMGILGGFFRRLTDDPLLVVESFFPFFASISNRNDAIATVASEGENDISTLVPPVMDVDLPDTLSREQKIRTLVRRLVDQEMAPHVHWLSASLASASSDESDEDGAYPLFALVASSDSQKKALRNPSFSSLLKLVGFRPPSASTKLWHFPLVRPVTLGFDAEYVRSVAQEAINEEGGVGQIRFGAADHSKPMFSNSELDRSQSESEVSSTASDFDLEDYANQSEDDKQVRRSKQDVISKDKKPSKFQEFLRAGLFNKQASEDDLPLHIEDDQDFVSDSEEAVDKQRPVKQMRVIDSDSE